MIRKKWRVEKESKRKADGTISTAIHNYYDKSSKKNKMTRQALTGGILEGRQRKKINHRYYNKEQNRNQKRHG